MSMFNRHLRKKVRRKKRSDWIRIVETPPCQEMYTTHIHGGYFYPSKESLTAEWINGRSEKVAVYTFSHFEKLTKKVEIVSELK